MTKQLRYFTYMEASESKWANSIQNITGFNSLKVGDNLYILSYPNKTKLSLKLRTYTKKSMRVK